MGFPLKKGASMMVLARFGISGTGELSLGTLGECVSEDGSALVISVE